MKTLKPYLTMLANNLSGLVLKRLLNALCLALFAISSYGQVSKVNNTSGSIIQGPGHMDRTFTFTSGDLGGSTSLDEVELSLRLVLGNGTPCSPTSYGVHEDLNVRLVSPTGTAVDLVQDRWGYWTGNPSQLSSFHLFPAIDATVNFDDDYSPNIETLNNWQAGNYAPHNPLSAFDGEDPTGVWTLRISDGNAQFGPSDFICFIDATLTIGSAPATRSATLGELDAFVNGFSASVNSTRLSDDKVLIIYRDNLSNASANIKAVVGTVSGTNISYGTTATVATSPIVSYTEVVAFSPTKAAVFYEVDGSPDVLKYRVLDIDGNTITTNSEETLGDGHDRASNATLRAVALNNNQVVVTYEGDAAPYDQLKIVAGTVSGSTITWGTTEAPATNISNADIARVSDSKFALVYEYNDGANSAEGMILAGTVSGNSISLGTPQSFESSSAVGAVTISALSESEVVVAYEDDGNSNDPGKIFYATISGTTFSFPGTTADFYVADGGISKMNMDALSGTEILIAVTGNGSDNSIYYTGLVSSDNIVLSSGTVFRAGEADDPSVSALTSDVAVINYTDDTGLSGTADRGESRVVTLTAADNPEISVKGNGNLIEPGNTPSSTDHTDFGTGASLSKTFTIENTGAGTLTLGSNAVTIFGTNASDFSVNTQPATTVAGSGSTTFTIDFSSSVASVSTAEIHINSDDVHEPDYFFSIQATGASASVLLSSSPTITFSDNTGFGDNIALDGEGGSVAISDINIQALPINSSGVKLSADPLEYHDGSQPNWPGYPAIITYGTNAFFGWSIRSDNGDNFSFMELDFHDWGNYNGATFVAEAFDNGSSKGSVTFTGNTTNVYIELANPGVLTSIFQNVDEIRLYEQGGGDSYISLNNIRVGTPIASNTAPTASSVSFSGTLEVGETLTGTYTYNDTDGDPESGSTYKWYRADNVYGGNKTAISGATGTTYALQAADENKYISFEVTPNDGTDAGSAVESSLQGPVPVTISTTPNNSLYFDSDARVTGLSGISPSQFTVEFWIYLDHAGNQYQGVYWSNNGADERGIYIENDNTVSLWNQTTTQYNSGTALSLNAWNHIAFAYDGSELKIYIDGSLENTHTVSGLQLPLTNVQMGDNNSGAWGDYNMGSSALDEFRIWSTARSASEIQNNKDVQFSSVQSGLERYYNFNEGTGGGLNTGITSLPDVTTSGNSGLLQGFTLSGTISNWIGADPITPTSLVASITSQTNVDCNGASTGSLTATATDGTANFIYSWSNGAVTSNTSSTTNTISSLAAGTYTVTITDANSNTATASATITQPTALVASASVSSALDCNGDTDGQVTASASGGTLPYTYSWDFGGTSATETGQEAGTYTVTITDANNCWDSASITITEPAILTATAIVDSNTSCNSGTDGGLTALPSGGTAPYIFAWSNSATTASMTGLSAGTYTVTVTDANSCTATTYNDVTEPAPFSVVARLDSNTSCNSGTDGGLTALPSGGTAPYIFAWSNSATTASMTGLSAGTYTVTVTDANSCTATTYNDVTEPAPFSVVARLDSNTSCNSGTDGGLTALPSGGTAPYIFAWSNSATTASMTGLAAGTYTVTVFDGNWCSTTESATVTVNDTSAPVVLTKDITRSLDQNGEVSITPSDVDNGSTDDCTITSTSVSPDAFTCNDMGVNTVTLTVIDNNGNSSSKTATVNIEDNTAPTVKTKDITLQLNSVGTAIITSSDIDDGSFDNCAIDHLNLSKDEFDCHDTGINTIVLTATDVNGNTSSDSAHVTIRDNMTPIAKAKNITVQLDANGEAHFTAEDVDNGSSDNCTIVSKTVTPNSFDCNLGGYNMVTLTVTDASGNSSSHTADVLVEDKIAPTALAKDITVQLDANGQANIAAQDVDAGSSDNCGIGTLTVSPNHFTCNEAGINTITFTATDLHGNNSTKAISVTVEDHVEPVMHCNNLDIYLDQNGNASINVSIINKGSSDNCTIDTMYLSKSEFSCVDLGVSMIHLTGVDLYHNQSNCQAEIRVFDTIAPVAKCASIDIYLSNTGTATITPAEVDAGSSDNCSIVDRSISITEFDCQSLGQKTVTLSVADIEGNMDSCTATINVLDTLRPGANITNPTVYLDEAGQVQVELPDVILDAWDNCAIDSVELSEDHFTCAEVGINRVSVMIRDISGNEFTQLVDIEVLDSLAPAVATKDLVAYLDKKGEAVITPSQIDNGSEDNCSIADMSLDRTSFGCGDLGINIVMLTVTDEYGNAFSRSATVTINDTIVPEMQCPADITTCAASVNGETVVFDTPLATDNCAATVNQVKGFYSGSNFPVGVTQVTFKAKDSNANATECSFNVTVHHTAAIELGSDTTICDNEALVLGINDQNYTGIQWSTGETTPAITVATTDDYWVAAIDGNGCATTDTVKVTAQNCTSIGTPVAEKELTLLVYPNPTTDVVFIESQTRGKFETVEILNTEGRVVKTKTLHLGASRIEISLGGFETGLYFVRITDKNQQSHYHKILLSK